MDLSAIRCHLVGFFKTFIEKVKRILDRFSFTPKACIVILTFYMLLVLVTLLVGWIGLLEYEIRDYLLAGATGAMLGLIYYILIIDNLSGLIGVIGSTLSWSFWRKWLSAEMLRALESRWNDEENIFDVGGAQGLSEDSIAKIPKIIVTSNNNVDSTSGERDLCSVCLQDFDVGETVRSLPGCHHMFHIPCIDKWLTMHGCCPLCRRDLL